MKRLVRPGSFPVVFLACFLLLAPSLLQAGGQKEDDGRVVLTTYLQKDPANPQFEGHNAVMEAFAEAHPHITFRHEYATGEAFHQKFQAMAASGRLPDLFTTYVGKRTAYITETGRVLDLRPYLEQEFLDGFTPAAWEPQGPEGEIYTVPPSMAVCHVMYANTAIMDELGLTFPETYQELLDQVETIRRAGYYPISLGNRDQWPMNSWLLSVLVDRLGGQEWFHDAMSGQAAFTDRPFVRSLEIIQEMVAKNVFSPGVNQMSNPEANQEFYQGRSVYLIDAGWRTSAMTNILDIPQQEAIYLGTFPRVDGSVRHGSSAAVPSEGFGLNVNLPQDPRKLEAALEFIRFYKGPQGAAIRLQHGEVPSYTLDYDDFDLPLLQRAYAEFQVNTPMGYVIDAKMDGEGMGILNPAIQAMMFGDLSPLQVARSYEEWVAANDSSRVGN
ncbi:ABC transporter substrate-binding protein [Alkalispirochaeta alkalica]|uniref:ABC transporter substrate-binding protein n=1 Tax=Alkalispirochaeta alkalica TaxID=46356 RepID=UPI0003639600|nr:extracellular solute-binding protein [Alkalispirochaeta alkalica]